MSCYDQSGVNTIVLYENIGIDITYNISSGSITDISTEGNIISISNDLRPDYTNVVTPGANYNLLNNHSIKFYNFDLVSGRTQLDTLRNIFGWYASITFYNGNQYLIDSPLFETNESTLVSSNTHTWELNLNSEVNTLGGLIESFVTIPWILDTGFWDNSGIWKNDGLWNY